MDVFRVILGLAARGVMWLCMWFIVGNAAVWAFGEGLWLLGLLEIGFFPATFFLWPFLSPDLATAWPFAPGTSFIPALVIALISYPVSTIIGGLGPVER